MPSPLVCKLFSNYPGIKLARAVWKWEQKMKFYPQEFTSSTQMQTRKSFHTEDHFTSLIEREQLRGGSRGVNRVASLSPFWLLFIYLFFWSQLHFFGSINKSNKLFKNGSLNYLHFCEIIYFDSFNSSPLKYRKMISARAKQNCFSLLICKLNWVPSSSRRRCRL